MLIVVAIVTSLTLVALAGALWLQTLASARLVRAVGEQRRREAEVQHQLQVYCTNVVQAAHDQLLQLSSGAAVREAISRNGISPYVSPESVVDQQIRALAKRLGITEREAEEYIRRQIPHVPDDEVIARAD